MIFFTMTLIAVLVYLAMFTDVFRDSYDKF